MSIKNEANDVVKELLKFLLCQLKENDMAISHYRIQKTVFKIKKELGCNHPLYEHLPFYWYEDGPFSNVVAQAFSKLRDSHCYRFSSNTIFLNNDSYGRFSSANSLINEYPSIKDISAEIFKDKNSFFNKFDEDIYIDYAPFPFMHPFKYILFNTAKNEELFYSSTPDEYLNVYYECLSEMPYDEIINDFSILFSRLFSRLELINDENQFISCWKYMRTPIQLSWLAFARGISIEFHDNFYDKDIESWKIDFDNRIKILNKSMNHFEEKTDNILNNSSKPELDSFGKRIYTATIGNYLKN